MSLFTISTSKLPASIQIDNRFCDGRLKERYLNGLYIVTANERHFPKIRRRENLCGPKMEAPMEKSGNNNSNNIQKARPVNTPRHASNDLQQHFWFWEIIIVAESIRRVSTRLKMPANICKGPSITIPQLKRCPHPMRKKCPVRQ